MSSEHARGVLHICKVFLPVKGGIQKVVYNLTVLLNNYSHDVITTGEDGAVTDETMDQAHIHRCRSYGQIASMPIAPSLISAVLKARKHDLIAVHYPFPLAEVALTLRPFAPPIVVHWHSEVIAQRKLKWLVAPFTFLTLLRAKSIVVTSEKMIKASGFLTWFQHKITMIPYGIEPVVVDSATHAEAPYFVLVGRHVSYKGIDVAINALKQAAVRLVIAGTGPLFEKHRKLASDIGVEENIEFMPHATDDEIVNLIQRSTALVVPSVRENEAFALVQLEAMRLGKAIINTDLHSSVPWVARNEQEALTVLPGDSQALADAMLRIVSTPTLAKQLGENGFQRFQTCFSAEQFATSVDELYSRIIGDIN